MGEVFSYVKNHNLGFEVPYEFAGETLRYRPDYIARVDDGGPEPLNLVIEVKGQRDEKDKAKAETMRNLWVPAVNNAKRFGRWGFLELKDAPYDAATLIREFIHPLLRRNEHGQEAETETDVENYRHDKAKRINIPTAENQSLVPDDEKALKVLRYPRNPDLDPQLVWRGKDAEDGAPLEVAAPPIYIQEKIHPRALIEDLRKQSARRKNQSAEQTDLFHDFNGLPEGWVEDAAASYYHDEGRWQNRMILGDSLLVMGSLAEREALRGKVQCIYFDPPYGIKFNSNWQPSTKSRDVKDGKEESVSREPEVVRAFRDTWKDGIHSYLSYLRDRLSVARDLLSETGSIFVQIGDENVHRVRAVMDEVFGDENFVVCKLLRKTVGLPTQFF